MLKRSGETILDGGLGSSKNYRVPLLIIQLVSIHQYNVSIAVSLTFPVLRHYKVLNASCLFIRLQSRFDILKIHSRRMNLMRGIDLKKIGDKMNGASGAELKVCFTSPLLLTKLLYFYINPS